MEIVILLIQIVLRAGVDYGLFLVINIDQKSYNMYDQSSQGKHVGVYITLHQPGYHIDLRQRAILAGPNKLTRISLVKRKVKRFASRDNCTLIRVEIIVDACFMLCYIYELKKIDIFTDSDAILKILSVDF